MYPNEAAESGEGEKRLTSYAIKIKALLLSPVDMIRQVFAALAVVWKNCAGQESIKLFPIKVGPVTLPHRYLFRSLQRYHTRASCCIMSPKSACQRHDDNVFLHDASAGYFFEQSGCSAPAHAGRSDESV